MRPLLGTVGFSGELADLGHHRMGIRIGLGGGEFVFRQAAENGEPPLRELFRYIVHGLLHLAGHEDEEDDDRARMEAAQEPLVARLWPVVGEV